MTNNSAKKSLRIAFENKFPGVTFKVTTRDHTAHVHYTDGPSHNKVFAFCQEFQEKGFDGMRDLSFCTGVKSGFDYVYPKREISPKFANSLEEYVSHFREEDRPSIHRRYYNVSTYLSDKDLELS